MSQQIAITEAEHLGGQLPDIRADILDISGSR